VSDAEREREHGDEHQVTPLELLCLLMGTLRYSGRSSSDPF
jgi:hypothetical protein